MPMDGRGDGNYHLPLYNADMLKLTEQLLQQYHEPCGFTDSPEAMLDALPFSEALGQQSPLAASFQDIFYTF